jgi:cyanophycinase
MPSTGSNSGTRGTIVPIGGAEDKLSDRAILRRFVEVCGGTTAVVSVIPTASTLPETGDRYREVFGAVGCGSVQILDYRDRRDTERADWLEQLRRSTGVFFTGGTQLRLSTLLGGTPVATAIRRLNVQGVHVAGTSAGAAFLSEHMIAFGKEGSTPIAGQVTLTPGLGLTNRFVVDQHFRERDRLGRLMTALAYNPFAIGVGLDEDTAAFISPDNRLEVVGTGAITIVDVSKLEYSSMAVAQEGKPVQLVGVRLHVLTNGGTFDLESRRALPGPEPVQDL